MVLSPYSIHQDMDVDYHTATYQRIDSGYAVSSVREGGKDEIAINYACSNDDVRYIDAPEKHDKRIRWVFQMIDWLSLESERVDVVAAWLEGKDEEVWLWMDGDEDHLPEPPGFHRIPECGRSAAIRSLQRRQQAMARMESLSR